MRVDTTGSIGGLITAFLIFINAGGAARAVILILGMISGEQEASENKKKLKNLIKFLIPANTIIGLVNTILRYYI